MNIYPPNIKIIIFFIFINVYDDDDMRWKTWITFSIYLHYNFITSSLCFLSFFI